MPCWNLSSQEGYCCQLLLLRKAVWETVCCSQSRDKAIADLNLKVIEGLLGLLRITNQYDGVIIKLDNKRKCLPSPPPQAKSTARWP
ncbi:hypothetical protein FGO68_gene9645 [Halteria grandinella]|uniref:Uncharacterized protein n=1 Tax=Halteria grandinella TaxID=5974 RepID=A0A8J8T8K8_HALGN|nr:hypothetical protein FGO68_gene9645 [Halteria grandinella]